MCDVNEHLFVVELVLQEALGGLVVNRFPGPQKVLGSIVQNHSLVDFHKRHVNQMLL